VHPHPLNLYLVTYCKIYHTVHRALQLNTPIDAIIHGGSICKMCLPNGQWAEAINVFFFLTTQAINVGRGCALPQPSVGRGASHRNAGHTGVYFYVRRRRPSAASTIVYSVLACHATRPHMAAAAAACGPARHVTRSGRRRCRAYCTVHSTARLAFRLLFRVRGT
jgi:hypothetical protein